FDLWFDVPHRPTRDADFLSFGPAELPHLEGVFKPCQATTGQRFPQVEAAVSRDQIDRLPFRSETTSAPGCTNFPHAPRFLLPRDLGFPVLAPTRATDELQAPF